MGQYASGVAGARQLDLVFERVDGTWQVIRVGTAQPVRDVRRLSRLLGERIEDVDPGPGVEAMRLVLSLVEPLSHSQQVSRLIASDTAEADLSELVDRLVNRLGPGKVYRFILIESDVPERSQFPVPIHALATTAAWISPWPRPVRLLDPPERVDALAMVPDHPPRGVVQIRVTPKTRNPFTIKALSISGVTWKWHFLNHAECVVDEQRVDGDDAAESAFAGHQEQPNIQEQ